MKRNLTLFLIISVFTLILAACGGEDSSPNDTANEEETTKTEELAFEPEAINEETDVCEVCGMAILDDEHAAQIILKNDKSVKFDDVGDLYKWVDENGEEDIGAKFVRDFNSEEWIQIKDATFVYGEEIQTPMAYGVISFKDEVKAESYIKKAGMGKIHDEKTIADHDWKMNEDMKGGHHDDHHEDEHHDEDK